MRHPFTLAVLATLTLVLLTKVVDAQPQPEPSAPPPNPTTSEPLSNFGSDNPSLRRAMNVARQAAERANGGLEKYRAEAVMFGPVAQAPVVDNGNGTWTFRFRGGTPGSPDLTVESVVTVSKDITQVALDYNGPIRSAEFPTPMVRATAEDDLALRRAMNLARQAAERVNGGLDHYRAEPSMYGSTEQAPFTTNPDGTWTFRFRGGPPGISTPTIESVVTVSRDRNVKIEANGPISDATVPNPNAPDGLPPRELPSEPSGGGVTPPKGMPQ